MEILIEIHIEIHIGIPMEIETAKFDRKYDRNSERQKNEKRKYKQLQPFCNGQSHSNFYGLRACGKRLNFKINKNRKFAAVDDLKCDVHFAGSPFEIDLVGGG